MYDEVENNRPPKHKNILCYTRYSIVQELNNKQSAKGLVDLEQHTAIDKQAI